MVLGMGNILLKDEGIGVHVVHALQETGLGNGDGLRLIDAGTCPDILLSLDAAERLIFVDAADGDCQPGTVYRFRPEDLHPENPAIQSLHEADLFQCLRMLDNLGLKPADIVIFGIQPKEIGWGLEPSTELAQRIPEIVRLILEETTQC